MSKTRKILSVVLAVVLVFALSVPAFAYNWEAADNGYSQTWALGTPVAVEGKTDEYTIDVSLTTDYATGAVQFVLAFTGDVALTGVTLGDDYYANADLFKDNDTGKVMLIPTTSDPNALDAMEIDGVVAVLTVTGTNGTVAIDENVKSETNQGGTLIAARLDPETLIGSQYIGQEDVTVDNAVNIGEPAETEFYGIDTGVVDDENKYVYGVPARTDVTDFGNYFKVENGSFTVTSCATGATLTVYDLEGGVFAEYTLIIFGDVNCDGNITAADVSAIKSITQNVQYSLVAKIAADVAAAEDITAPAITASDMSAVKGYTQNIPATVNPYAN